MTKQETAQLMAYLAGLFPNLAISKESIQSWSEILKDYDASKIMAATKNAITHSPSDFAPSIGRILEEHNKFATMGQLSALEAFAEVVKVGKLREEQRAGKLSDKTQRALQIVGGWFRYGRTTDEELPFYRNQFVEAYNAIKERDNYQELSTPEAKKFLDSITPPNRPASELGQPRLKAIPDLQVIKR